MGSNPHNSERHFTPQLFVMASWMVCGKAWRAGLSYIIQSLSIVFSVWLISIREKELALYTEWSREISADITNPRDMQPVSAT
jgi:hypothetical protein